MYLKKMIVSGFKSFADKMVIDFKPGITGIVGPNGSGKSNVVDAIRWVLGEQSIKSLRGDGNMTDVIFSGSKSRGQMNVASVSLVFDNHDHYLSLDFDDIVIKRRVYQDGTNEYLLNNEKCRLKDIIDILLDSGMAKESFNIISQGKIEEIINHKPEMRRSIFEEAAGVLKYRKRKEEAIHKLERTHDNMSRVEDIISELEKQVNPLERQRNQALQYQEKTKELEKVEVALITKDISNYHFAYETMKQKIDRLNEELLSISTENTTQEAKIEEFKAELNQLDANISEYQKVLLDKITKVEKINSEKNILLERKKYEVEDQKLHDNLLSLKNKQLKLETDIHALEQELEVKKDEYERINENYHQLEKTYHVEKQKRIQIETTLTNLLRQKSSIEYQIKSLEESIENSSSLPYAVRNLLEHHFTGIHHAIGNVIEVEEKYACAITTSLGSATSYVMVETEQNAKQAISYLKQHNLGRVTFFPLNIIQPKRIDQDTLSLISKMNGFLGIASKLVKCDKKYQSIIENQLGNVIVATNMDDANQIHAKIHHRYKIVTLEGELLHVGGSLTGGNIKAAKNVITERYELEQKEREIKQIEKEIAELEKCFHGVDTNLRSYEDQLYLNNKERLSLEAICHQKEQMKSDFLLEKDHILQEINGTNHILKHQLSEEEEIILSSYYQAIEEKKEIEILLETTKKKRDLVYTDLENFEFSLKRENSNFNSKSKELRDLEIESNRLDVKMDTLLSKLNEEYHLTYEKASKTYLLTVEEDIARNQVNRLKREITDLGVVNLGAIEEYERINTRYQFLLKQKEDLLQAEHTLLEIIEEMDHVMTVEFEKTFKIIQTHFEETFRELFKGGSATLKLTDPNHLLETGIEIIASPPGKKLSSISLLSGGEKTFTAISLLFAILKSRPVPFCILDEVEAALDEVNVDSFGEYISKLKEKTQFILITHKKRTMEYADVLYGITMQESGVSKLVSVKLEELK